MEVLAEMVYRILEKEKVEKSLDLTLVAFGR